LDKAFSDCHFFYAVFEIFGTFNRSTATPSEITLSHTMETVIANFVKNPLVSPAPHWPKYVPGNRTKTLAKLAYDGNVGLGDVVQAVESDSVVRALTWVTYFWLC
jgi:hypothetical protein